MTRFQRQAQNGWSDTQQKRLLMEKRIVARYFPGFRWMAPTEPDNTRLEGSVRTNSGQLYTLRAYLPPDYPNGLPKLTVIYPSPLMGYGGMNLRTAHASMHTLAPVDGYVSICHYSQEKWTPDLTLYLVLLKGRVWLEAYEGHKGSGKPIDQFLFHV